MAEFGFIFILLLVLAAEVFFIVSDVKKVIAFEKSHPSKKENIKYFGSGILHAAAFVCAAFVISLVISLIPSCFIWFQRNVSLIEALRPGLSFGNLLYKFFLKFLFPVSLILFFLLKFLKKKLALSIIFLFVLFFFVPSAAMLIFDFSSKYYKNPLADTEVSETFKPLNVPLLKRGMTKTEVLELLGEPVFQNDHNFTYADMGGRGMYEYLLLYVEFENDIVVEIYNEWEYED